MNARLQAHEQTISEMQRAASEAAAALRSQFAELSAQVGAARQQIGPARNGGPATDAAAEGISLMQESIDYLSRRIAFVEQNSVGTPATSNQVVRLETELDSVRTRLMELQSHLAANTREF